MAGAWISPSLIGVDDRLIAGQDPRFTDDAVLRSVDPPPRGTIA
jgi:hypothetical protein